ncbi:hypothetical protein [Pseudoalteromonas sp. HM-SA03]|nr:hypothetical protein [Pseudoalteromonas sp. HM-SA03]
MKQSQGGAKLSLVVVSVILLGVSAWFNQASASELQGTTSTANSK